MIYKRSPHYRPFIRENLWLADFPHKGPVMRNFDVFFALGMSKQMKNGDWDAMKPMWQYYNDVIWARWRLKSPASRLFTQPFIQGADQIKYHRSVSLAFERGIQRWQVNSPHKRACNAEKVSIWWRHHEHCNTAWHVLETQRTECSFFATLVCVSACHLSVPSHWLKSLSSVVNTNVNWLRQIFINLQSYSHKLIWRSW